MNLTFEQIKSIASGAVRIEQQEDGIHFHRFTKEQEQYYAGTEYNPKQLATAGVRLHFKTDSTVLKLKVKVSQGSSRKYFAHDILVNGKLVGSLCNFDPEKEYVGYSGMPGEFGEFSGEFALGAGVKEVCVHFPWSVCSVLQQFGLDDGAFVDPVKKSKILLAFGDSITQGYDALHPCSRYIAKVADLLDAEEICKAIGGEVFRPALAAMKDELEPDYITVAYGTNDWGKSSAEDFQVRCQAFFSELVRNYPDAKIYAITPIWRKEYQEKRAFGCFEGVERFICDTVKEYENITCIRGWDLVPAEEHFFGDLHLHPNDEGFEYYFQGIKAQIL